METSSWSNGGAEGGQGVYSSGMNHLALQFEEFDKFNFELLEQLDEDKVH